MSKSRIIKKLKKKHPKLSDYQLKKVYQRILKTLKEGLKKDQSIELRSIGTIFKKEIKEKKSARNPKTGELIYVPKKFKVRFRASKNLKNLIN